MCGIAGELGGSGTAAEAMIQALRHRGPDGLRTEQLPGAALAHARLSIIDLVGGWQPLHAACATLVGNGEIFNYLELTRDHGLAGQLATGSDFEPLLHLYALEGERAFQRLRGMYAFCLVGPDGRSWLARDPFGIKPLYILEHDGGLAFASEPRAFFAAGLIRPLLDDEAARELLDLNYVLGDHTAFQGLRRVAPGEVLEVREGRIVFGHRHSPISVPLIGKESSPRTSRVWSPRPDVAPGHEFPTATDQPSVPPHAGLGKDLLVRLDAVLEDSVRVHQRSDVP